MKKRAQITVFILTGLIILIIFSLLFFTRRVKDKDIEIPADIVPVKVYIDSCIKKVSSDGLSVIGLKGGYYGFSTYSIEYTWEDYPYPLIIPYYYYNGKNIMPSKTIIEDEIASYIKDFLPECIQNLSEFATQYDIKLGDISVNSVISKEDVTVNVKYPIVLKKGELTFRLDRFSTTIPIRLGILYDLIDKIIQQQVQDDINFCITCIPELLENTNVSVELIEFSSNTSYYIIFNIFDHKSIINDAPYMFIFASKYDISSKPVISEGVKITPIEDQNAIAGYLFSYDVDALGTNLEFSDSTDLFDINAETGLIEFTPTIEQAGTHIIMIITEDAKGNKDFETFKLSIKGFGATPIIDYIGFQTAYVGQEFNYQVKATDTDSVTIFYLDDTDLFNISKSTGLISFIPTAEQEGDYIIRITVIDSEGNSAKDEMSLIILG